MEKHETAHGKLGLEFANSLIAGDFPKAHSMLSESLKAELSPDLIQQKYEKMIRHPKLGPATSAEVEEILDKWAYVAVLGQRFAEGVAVTVADESGRQVIRKVEWGRP